MIAYLRRPRQGVFLSGAGRGEVAELAEGGGLLNRCAAEWLHPGFESLPLRQSETIGARFQSRQLLPDMY